MFWAPAGTTDRSHEFSASSRDTLLGERPLPAISTVTASFVPLHSTSVPPLAAKEKPRLIIQHPLYIGSTVCFAPFSPSQPLCCVSEASDESTQELSARGLWACPLWDTEDAAHANAHACGAACPSKGAAGRCGEGVPCSNLPHALEFRCLPLLRRSTVSGQLSVPFCICQHPRRKNAAAGHDSETFDHFC